MAILALKCHVGEDIDVIARHFTAKVLDIYVVLDIRHCFFGYSRTMRTPSTLGDAVRSGRPSMTLLATE
jgi:hypothetical protein